MKYMHRNKVYNFLNFNEIKKIETIHILDILFENQFHLYNLEI